MRRLNFLIIVFLAVAMTASVAGPTLAQQAPPLPAIQRPSQDLDRRVIVARQLIHQQNYEGASALLEVVLEDDPGNRVIQSLLMTCYEQLKYYEKAEVLARDFVRQSPQNLSYRLKLAELLMAQGKREYDCKRRG
jgi:predicted Zn-dependent protease